MTGTFVTDGEKEPHVEHPVCKTNSTAILLQHSEKATLSSQTKAVNKFHDVEAARHTAEISRSLNIYEQIQLLAPFHLKAPLLSWPLLCKGTPHYSPYPLSLSLTSWASMHIPEQFSETPENFRLLWTTPEDLQSSRYTSRPSSKHTTVQATPTLFSVYMSHHPSRVSSEYSLHSRPTRDCLNHWSCSLVSPTVQPPSKP